MSRPEPPVHIAVAVVCREDQFLVGHRQPGQALAGLAEFPGGKVQPGESAAAAAVREVREECGIDVVPTSWRREVRHTYDHGELHLTFVGCQVISLATPHPPFQWIPRADLSLLPFPPANQGVLAELAAGAVDAGTLQ